MSKYYEFSGYTDVIEALLKLGASINIKSCNDLTSLEWAKRFTKNEVVELLESFMYINNIKKNLIKRINFY